MRASPNPEPPKLKNIKPETLKAPFSFLFFRKLSFASQVN